MMATPISTVTPITFQTLYNLRNDPFEIDNLLDTKNPKQMHLDEVKKIKKWAKNQLKCWNSNASGGVSY